MVAARLAAAALLLSATVSAGCQPMHQEASLRLSGKSLPNSRTWAEPSSPRPDLPPDRDSGKD